MIKKAIMYKEIPFVVEKRCHFVDMVVRFSVLGHINKLSIAFNFHLKKAAQQ